MPITPHDDLFSFLNSLEARVAALEPKQEAVLKSIFIDPITALDEDALGQPEPEAAQEETPSPKAE